MRGDDKKATVSRARTVHRLAFLRAATLAALLAPATALASAGYFQLGYGIKSKGMAGVAIALPQDALAVASNPAGMVWVGNRVDAGVEGMTVDRGSEIVGNNLGLGGSRDANGRKRFAVPDFGLNRMLGERWSLGVSVYGNGGMTRYIDNPLSALDGSKPGGMEYVQAVVAPVLAVKIGDRYSAGIALNLVVQDFVARGIEHFDHRIFSESPGFVTNRGRDRSSGAGVRLGGLARVSDTLALGASWQPRIRMSRFEHYRGLLKNQGNFDVPENYAVGAALVVAPGLTVAGDLQRINFAGVSSLGTSFDCFLAVKCLLGSSDGPGSGWRSTTVYKAGISYEPAPRVVLRAGMAWLRQPIPESQTLLNIFAPAVTERHVTLGTTWQISPRWELSASYMRAAGPTVHGRGSIPAGFPPGGVGGGEANLRMKQEALGISLGWRY